MEKITSYELIKALKRNLKYLIVTVLVAGFLGFAFGKFVKKADYTADTTLIIVSDDEKEISYNKILLNEKLANIYGEVLKSYDLFQNVIDELNLDKEANELEKSLKSTISPEAGMITLEYSDTNRDRAIDTLKGISEEFRKEVKKYLKTNNIDYLQKVNAPKEANNRAPIFAIIAMALGLFLGLLFIMFKEVLSQKINDSSYILFQDNLLLLGECEKNNDKGAKKVAAKILASNENLSFGITNFDKKDNGNVPIDIAKELSKSKKTLFVDLNDENGSSSEFANIEEILENNETFKNDMDLSILALKKQNDIDEILEDERFKDLMTNAKEEFSYIVFNEKSVDFAQVFLANKYEDGKIFMVNEGLSDRNTFQKTLEEFKSLSIKILGVIYNK